MDINGICIASSNDEHGPIYVYQTRTARILSFDGKIYQSCMKLNDTNGLDLDYTVAMMSGLLFIPTLRTATIMGLGAGSIVKKLLSSFSEIDVHAIEYRESVAKIAKDYFYLPETERLYIHIDDAADYVKNTDTKSDIIFSDLYSSKGMELKQVHTSYLHDCKNALNKQGILVLNICHTSSKLRQEFDELLAREFENKLISFNVEGGNTIILAFNDEIPLVSRSELVTKARSLQEIMNIQIESYALLLGDKLGL